MTTRKSETKDGRIRASDLPYDIHNKITTLHSSIKSTAYYCYDEYWKYGFLEESTVPILGNPCTAHDDYWKYRFLEIITHISTLQYGTTRYVDHDNSSHRFLSTILLNLTPNTLPSTLKFHHR